MQNDQSHFHRNIFLVFIGLIIFLVYFWTTSSSVVLEDDGYFLLSAYFNGISHPPGYPLYTVIAHLFSQIPVGSVALRVHLLSSIFAVMATIILWLFMEKLTNNRIVASVTIICLAFSDIFWSQAIISEVYSLNVLLVLLLVYLSFEISSETRYNKKIIYICLMSIIYGLGLSNHWPLIILSTPMLMAFCWPERKLFLTNFHLVIIFLLMGLTPYAWLYFHSQSDPFISFYGPLENLHDLWFFISRQGYAEVDYSPSAGVIDKLLFLKFVITQTVYQFGYISLPFLLTGFVMQWRYKKNNFAIGLCLGYLGSTLVLIILLGFDYDYLHRSIFRVYPIVSYTVCAIWIGIGLEYVVGLKQLGKYIKTSRKFIGYSLGLVISCSVFAHNLPGNYRNHDTWAADFARTLLDSLPRNAILFVKSDTNTGPIGYMNLVEHYREDITLFHSTGQVLKNRLYRPFKINYQEMQGRIDNFIQSSDREIFYTGYLYHNYGIEDYGLYYRVLKNKPKGFVRAITKPEILNYWYNMIKRGEPIDPWERIHFVDKLSDGCRVLNAVVSYSNDPGQTLKDLKEAACDNLQGIFLQIERQLDSAEPDWDYISGLLDKGQNYLSTALLKSSVGFYYYYRGIQLLAQSDELHARTYFQKSVQAWDDPENPARQIKLN